MSFHFTVCVIGPATPEELLASPEYTPRMAWLPAASELVVQSAAPLETGIVEHPLIVEVLAVKRTVPVAAALAVMMRTVKVTDWPAEIV